MKHLLPRAFSIFLLVFISTILSAQNISVYPSYPPKAICDGDQVTVIINPAVLPSGKTLDHYNFYFAWPDTVTRTGSRPASVPNPEQYTAFNNPPGNWVAHGVAVATDGSSYSTGDINYTVWYKPIANFSLATTSKDTQCFKGNSFCFLDSSKQNPKQPSNSIASCQWVWGDGGISNNCSPIVCQSYNIGRHDILLKITDDHGCSSIKFNPKGHDSIGDSGVIVIGNPTPDFNWAGHIQCFGSDYIFKRLSPATIANIKSYTWDFGDSTTYSATAPFNSLQNSHFDTISHRYILPGIFKPSLIITNTFGCTDTLQKTPGNIMLPGNLVYDTKITASTSPDNGQNNMDSFCAGSNLANVYFNHSVFQYAQPGSGDFVWDFGDPGDPHTNLDSISWNPLHIFSGVRKYIVKLTIKNVCRDSSMYDTIEVLGPRAKIESTPGNSIISSLQKYSCNGSDTVDFVNNSSYYQSNHVKRVWDFDDDFAPLCTAYSVPKNPSSAVFINAGQQYNNSNHFYVLNGTTYAGKMNCRYSNDSLPRHLYTDWDSVYSWYQSGKTFPVGWNTPNVNANTPLTITPSKPVPDPFWQAQGRLLNLTSGTLHNKFDSITYTIPGFGTFKRYGNQLLPNSTLTFHEYVFRYTVNRTFTVKLSLSDSLNHASGDPVSCASVDTVNISHGKPDAHGMSVTGKQCSGLNPPGSITFNLRANGIGAGTKPSCGQTYIYMNFDSLADMMDNTPLYLDAFTSWGVDNGSEIVSGPGINITPGGLTRNTFYSGLNWNPFSAWTGPEGSIINYHYGGNSGTPPPADEQGFVTIGLFLGSGQKDTTFSVWQSNYQLNQNNNGTLLINPATGQPGTYQSLSLINNMRNIATPPPNPIPDGWADDSIAYHYHWKGIIKSTPQIRSLTPTIWDTLLTVQYIDERYPRCLSDTVWYHNFLHIKDLDPTFVKSPLELAQLRERDDTMMIVYRNPVQDSVHVAAWNWGDNIVTIDSFNYAGYDISDGYYTHGARRVRYNIDYTNGPTGTVLDSLVWPNGVYGQRQYQQPVKFYSRMFDLIGTIGSDTLVLRNKFPSTTHVDQWYPYTNYHDTIHLSMHDTILYTQFRTIDTALMMLPVTHQYKKTSWEMGMGKVPGAIATDMDGFLENTATCQYNYGTVITVGVIDSFRIRNVDERDDSVFCRNSPVYFLDSVRYFRYDDIHTNPPLFIFGTSRPTGYHGFGSNYGPVPPQCFYGWDTINFWSRDAMITSDTLINEVSDYPYPFSALTSSMIEFRYFESKWTNWDFNMVTGIITYLPPANTLGGHYDMVLRGGNVQVVIPDNNTDPAYMNPYPGMVIFYPITGALGTPGIYVWGGNGWDPSFAPLTIDSLSTLSDISKTPSPVKGRTLIYNKGKGNVERTGMYYWDGQWNFIANSPYTSFPYFTHRLYWNFGDGSAIYQGVRPVHQYNTSGKYQVSMISRDSVGQFDTCISFVNIGNLVAKPIASSSVIGCKDTAAFRDSSYASNGANIVARRWWFGDQANDTVTAQSVLLNPVWRYKHNGKFKVKLAVFSDDGCSDTGYVNIFADGPRPAFKLFTPVSGCIPYRAGIKNMADSFDLRAPNDTPTLSTFLYWGDGQFDVVIGRRDTVWHTYTNAGTYHVYGIGRDALPLNQLSCPAIAYPDTLNGQAKIVILVSSSNLGKISGNANPHINDTATYSVPNIPLATYTWSVQGGNIQSGAGSSAIIVKWPSTSGVYQVIAEKANSSGCHDRDTLKVHVLMTSIKELSSVSEIKMYPNPATQDVTLSLNSQKNQDLTIKIYDVLGKVCVSDYIRSASGLVNKNYSLSEMGKGMYFVEISNGEEKTVFKLLIE